MLRRVWTEHLGQDFVDVLRPIRRPRSKLLKGDRVARDELQKAVRLAVMKLATYAPQDTKNVVLIRLDADSALPCLLAPEVLSVAQEFAPPDTVDCILANVEFETWFVAAAQSLTKYLDLRADDSAESLPEAARSGKLWVEQRFRGVKYSETQDQPRLTASMDLQLCRRRSPSFDKLCRALETRIHSD